MGFRQNSGEQLEAERTAFENASVAVGRKREIIWVTERWAEPDHKSYYMPLFRVQFSFCSPICCKIDLGLFPKIKLLVVTISPR